MDLDDTPIHYETLQAPGCLWAFSFPSTPPQKWIEQSHQRDMDAIEQGLKFNYKIPTFEGYVLGPNAYEEFAKNLTAQRNSEIAYHGVSYVGECLFEQKRNLAEFLKRMASRYKNSKVNTLLINASNDFSEIADILKKFRRLFPFSLKGDFNKNDCRKGAALLRSISPFELSAFASLRTVLDIWKI